MKQLLRLTILSASLLFLTSGHSPVGALTSQSMALLRQTVFEVVVPKLESDAITYKKPLPLYELSYVEQNDAYRPVGTAFTIGPNQFLTAAHVLALESKTQWGPYYIRSTSGKLFKIKDILNYSYSKDLIEFSVENAPKLPFLSLNQTPQLDSKIFSIGNALGEGIVARGGSLTSRTPEEIDGEWEWIRFSAPASPGNSGGPLVDQKGRVIGIVTRKSPNENLNYALPIQLALTHPKNIASYICKGYFYIPNINKTLDFERIFTLNLPMPIDTLRIALQKEIADYEPNNLKTYLSELKDSEVSFPNSAKANDIVYKNMPTPLPLLAKQQENDMWVVDRFGYGQMTLDSEDQIMFIQTNNAADRVLMFLNKGKDQNLTALLTDDKILVEYILKTGIISRTVGSQKVMVTSLGNASYTEQHIDNHGRKWALKSWPIPFNDHTLFCAVLPIPAGLAMMVVIKPTKYDCYIEDYKVQLDYILQDYFGSTEEWAEFLTLSDHLPAFFKSLEFKKEEKMIELKSTHLNVNLKAPYFNPKSDYDLYVSMGFKRDLENTYMDIEQLAIYQKFQDEYIAARIFHKPDTNVSPEIQNFWKNLANKKFPYNSEIQYTQGTTQVFIPVGDTLTEKDHIIAYQLRASGKKTKSQMKDRIKKQLK